MACTEQTGLFWTRTERRGLWALFVVALAVRLWALGRAELWQDEAIFVNIMSNPAQSPSEVARNYWQILISMAQMPFAGILQNLWMHLLTPWFGDETVRQTFWLRLPMALAGALAVPGILLVARRVLDRPAAWCAALMSAFFLFPVYYSREAYCYAYILLFSSYGLYFWLRALEEDRRRSAVGFFVCMVGMAYSHLAGVICLGALLAATGGGWLWRLFRHDTAGTRRIFRVGVAGGLAFLAVSPYFLHFVLHNTAHTQAANPVAIPVILNDSLSKMFLGTRPLASILAWILFAVGLFTLVRTKTRAIPARLLAAATLLGFLLLAVATHRSQYISARYFSPLMAAFYLLFAAGLSGVANWCPRRRSPRIALFSWTGAALLIHALFFLPPYYKLTAKSVDFGAIARWINANLAPGTPYLMESAYELRFVGDYFPTPGKIGAAPYVHGGGPEELHRLHARQIDFMTRFPEAPFIESAHHGAGSAQGIWDWPQRNFRQHVRLSNDALRHLIQRGIYPGEPRRTLQETEFRTDIYYNTAADQLDVARAATLPALFRFNGWQTAGQPVSPQETDYFRFRPASRGTIQLVNLTGIPLRGRIRLEIALAAPPSAAEISLRLPQGAPLTFRRSAGMFHTLETPELEFPPGETAFEASGQAAGLQAVLVRKAEFVANKEPL
jgi:4-amino-4-deoxy-L-arabinose transferase-like glycosyltransferase